MAATPNCLMSHREPRRAPLSASLSRSRQLRTLLEKPRMEQLLKTARRKVPPWRTKSKYYFRFLFVSRIQDRGVAAKGANPPSFSSGHPKILSSLPPYGIFSKVGVTYQVCPFANSAKFFFGKVESGLQPLLGLESTLNELVDAASRNPASSSKS